MNMDTFVEFRITLCYFFLIVSKIVNDGRWCFINRYLYIQIQNLGKEYSQENIKNMSENACLERHLQSITTWVAVVLEELHGRYSRNELLRNEIENLQKRILEKECTIVSLNNETIKNLNRIIYHKQYWLL